MAIKLSIRILLLSLLSHICTSSYIAAAKTDIQIATATTSDIINMNSYFIINKEYPMARIAQSTANDGDVFTYENQIYPDQLWQLRESDTVPGYYYIANVVHTPYRLAKYDDSDSVIVYSGQYQNDQLWKFDKEGDYYRIFNYAYSSAKLAKWGKGDRDFGSYAGPNCNNQLWKLEPRYRAQGAEKLVWDTTNK